MLIFSDELCEDLLGELAPELRHKVTRGKFLCFEVFCVGVSECCHAEDVVMDYADLSNDNRKDTGLFQLHD